MATEETSTPDVAKATAVKAAFLYKVAGYVRWPDEVFEAPESPIVLRVLGRDPFGPRLDRAVDGKHVGDRGFQVRRINLPPPEPEAPILDEGTLAEISEVQLLFVCESERRWSRLLVESLAGQAILTVSDIEGFARRGGMVEITLENRRLFPVINRAVAEDAGLVLNAKLLKLARIIESAGLP